MREVGSHRSFDREARLAEERRLVDLARLGDIDALGDLFAMHAVPVRRLLLSVLGPSGEIDDLSQEVFVQAQRSLSRFRGESAFSTWLHSVAVHTAMDHLRAAARRRAHLAAVRNIGTARTNSEGSSRDEARELLRRLFELLDAMSPKRRVAFCLFELEGLSLDDIAKTLGISPEAAKSRVFFARRELFERAAADEALAPWLEEANL